jgi:hypothetical protein
MIHADFTEEEIEVIKDVLESYLSGIATEIYGLDSLSSRKTEELVHKREIVEEVIERIEH